MRALKLHLSPRVYPVAFADFMAHRAAGFMQTCKGQPQLPELVPAATTTFETMSWNSDPEFWKFAGLAEVFCYLRGAKGLKLPEAWKPLIPRSLES